MENLINNQNFITDYQKMKDVTLNTQRHTAPNAYEHSEMVTKRAIALAQENKCSQSEIELLTNLARVHDIGKITGTANPSQSVEMLRNYGINNDDLIHLVKYHDINLSWYIASQKGQPPSHKAWIKMISKVNIKLLCLFMIADRVDCPGEWKNNDALMWFLAEAKTKKYIIDTITIDGEII